MGLKVGLKKKKGMIRVSNQIMDKVTYRIIIIVIATTIIEASINFKLEPFFFLVYLI